MLQSCCAVFTTSILSSFRFHSVLGHVELEKSFWLLGIKFHGYAKEEAKQQPATRMDFLTRKKNTRNIFTSFIPSHIRKTAAGFLVLLMPG